MQYVPLTDGTYFINRWFASIESIPKTIVPIGYVGVVVSYYGRSGQDLSGQGFRHGERVAEGERGVLEKPLGPGKYAFNTYAGNIVLVPTTNFVLHWVTGRTETHRYDESLRSIDLVTKDAYEPTLPLSVVVHIDYQKAPNVIQRFGDVKKLITQTLDPMLSAYFRDVAHKRTMLELLQDRDAIQHESSSELGRKFHNFDIECVDVLIGKPDTAEAGGKIETLLEQLRLRQLSLEQVETYSKQVTAAEKLAGAQRGPGPGADADPAVQLAGADPDRRERGRGPARPGPQAGRAGGRHRRGREPAAHPGRPRRRCPDLPGGLLRGVGLAPQDPVVLGPAAVRPVGRRPEPGQVHPAAGPRAGLHRRGAGGNGTAGENVLTGGGAAAGSGLMGLLLSLLVAEKSGFQLAEHPAWIGAPSRSPSR